MSIASLDFDFVAGLIRQRSSIHLQPGKEYLVEARLAGLIRSTGEPSIGALVNRLRRGDEWLSEAVVEALTTNETLWFRDVTPFETFSRQLLPAVAKTSVTRRLVIWSAACSSGQEAYSLAMLLLDWLPRNPGHEARIIGTDISAEMVRRAQSGRYTQQEVNRGLPAPSLVKHFEQSGRHWVVGAHVRELATFSQANLAKAPDGVPRCDVVFLRNVLIYFDTPTRRRVIEHVGSVLRFGGFLVLGGTENAPNLGPGWQRVGEGRAAAFQRV